MHACANVVCSPDGVASAVLLRAGEVVDGVETARERRPAARSERDLARGPGRLCAALGIALADTGSSLVDGPVRLELPRHPVPASSIASGPRTGVSGAGGTDAFPWRFRIEGDPTVSPYKAHAPKRRPS